MFIIDGVQMLYNHELRAVCVMTIWFSMKSCDLLFIVFGDITLQQCDFLCFI